MLGRRDGNHHAQAEIANIVVTRLSMMTSAGGWASPAPARCVAVSRQLAYRGRPGRRGISIDGGFAQGSTNSRVGLDGMAMVIDDVAKRCLQADFMCATAPCKVCLPIFDETGKTRHHRRGSR